MSKDSFERALYVTRHKTGVVIPVYLPQGVDIERATALLRDTATAYCAQVSNPSYICLSVDGDFGHQVAVKISETLGTSYYLAPVNKGKLQAARNGTRTLLNQADLTYVAVVDQDGDHFANELLSFVRAALHTQDETGDERMMILGRRISTHRPLGFLRGELEALADRVLLDALAYHAARSGTPLRLEYATALEEVPDFHSGYKLFSHPTANAVFLAPTQEAGVSDDCYYRHACEAVMVVEALLSGARMGVVNRSTFNEQPVSTFGLFDRCQLMADTIIWPCKRLGVPLPFVEQWMANHTPCLLLGTLVPEGQQDLARVRDMVIAAFTDEQSQTSTTMKRPLFV